MTKKDIRINDDFRKGMPSDHQLETILNIKIPETFRENGDFEKRELKKLRILNYAFHGICELIKHPEDFDKKVIDNVFIFANDKMLRSYASEQKIILDKTIKKFFQFNNKVKHDNGNLLLIHACFLDLCLNIAVNNNFVEKEELIELTHLAKQKSSNNQSFAPFQSSATRRSRTFKLIDSNSSNLV